MGFMSSAKGKIGAGLSAVDQFAKDNAAKIEKASSFFETQPNYRAAEGPTNRDEQVISWRLPNGSAVQMYINPQSLNIKEEKQITTTRTKGGFVIQYWGANLTEITLTGITGSSGVQGINLLRDIYLSENRAFDQVARTQMNDMMDSMDKQGFNSDNLSVAASDLASTLRNRNFILRPSLASLAASVLMFYQGVEYRGFFKSFTVNETADRTGIFEYTMMFTATDTRGRRSNVFAWQKDPQATGAANQLINGVGNLIRGAFGMGEQPPQTLHPESAPLTFGGSSSDVASAIGLNSTEQRNILSKGTLT
jgi:hypothetical protein